jgi:hypothetical protein
MVGFKPETGLWYWQSQKVVHSRNLQVQSVETQESTFPQERPVAMTKTARNTSPEKIPCHRSRRPHGRTMNFFEAAARRLAWNDYEKVSVAMICRDVSWSWIFGQVGSRFKVYSGC